MHGTPPGLSGCISEEQVEEVGGVLILVHLRAIKTVAYFALWSFIHGIHPHAHGSLCVSCSPCIVRRSLRPTATSTPVRGKPCVAHCSREWR